METKEQLEKRLYDELMESIEKLIYRRGNVVINRVYQKVYIYDSVAAAENAKNMTKWSHYFRRCFDEMNTTSLVTKQRYIKK
ncbi:hypothetical protein [Vagococcus fessus]|uniref:Uncharacterized protein n=1 Tax=Vagococcus fessus TaxID=120370 RepID=A0A430A584_9ENTE|nr:hypothetical protein [Vagococcus fessus]RSU01973.1 hypothetical protein CBF31_09410 [Vagococcus fessus]